MKNKKFEWLVIIIIVVVSCIIFGIYLLYNQYKNNHEFILFTKPFNILECFNYKCENVSNKDEYNDKEYDTYINSEYKGLTKLYFNQNNDKYYAFNSSNENIFDNTLDSDDTKYYLLGVSGKINVVAKPVVNEAMTQNDFYNLSKLINMDLEYYDYVPLYKHIADFDGDGINETIYHHNFIDNDKYYSFIAIEDDGKYKIIEFNSYNNSKTYQRISIEDVIDVYNDGELEFIAIKRNGNDNFCSQLYYLKGNKFVTNTKCELD